MRLARRGFLVAASALAAASAVTASRVRARTVSAESSAPPIGAFVDVDGTSVHYVQRGAGPHVVMIHGAGGNVREFTFDLMDRLTDRYTVTAFDRPGLGYTDRLKTQDSVLDTEGESPMEQADLLRAAASIIGVKDPIVVGHSFGGIVALAWANAGLDSEDAVNARGLVSLAGVAMPWPGELGAYYTVNGSALGGAVVIPLLSAFASQARIASTIEGIFAPQPVPAGYADHVGAELAVRAETFRANVQQVNTLRPHVVEMAKRYSELSLPIEILHGEADKSVPIHIHSEELIKIVPGARLTRLPGVGHMPHHADPEATVELIDRAADRAGLR